MDPDSPTSRVERTFWTVWYYITEAVNRFFRPEPANITSNDPNTIQESAVDSESANTGHAEVAASARGGDEEQSLAPASLLSSSRPVVAWELCTTDIDLEPDDESMRSKTQLSKSKEGEEQLTCEENDDVGLQFATEDKQKGNGDQKLSTGGQDETPEDGVYEGHANAGSLSLTGDAMSEDMEECKSKAVAKEETLHTTTLEEPQEMGDTMTNIQAKEADHKMQHEDEDLQVEDSEVKLCTITDLSLEEEDKVHIEEVQRNEAIHEEVEDSNGVLQVASENENKIEEKEVDNQLSISEEFPDDISDFKGDPDFTSQHFVDLHMACNKIGVMFEDEVIAVEPEHAMVDRSESKDAREESTLNVGAVIEEENVKNNQTIDEASEQEDNIKTVMEDGQEEDLLTEHVTCSEDIMQNIKTELHVAEDGEKDDTKVRTKTRETDDGETESCGMVINEKSLISVDERFYEDHVEEERLSSEVGDKEVTVKPEGETGQEMNGEFKNIPPAMCEGRLVVSQELNFPTWEETQEGLPEYNNEPDENTTQRFLEGDGEEIQGSLLPEEGESLRNGGCSSGADHLLEKDLTEEEQESTQDIKSSVDAGLPQETEKPLVEAVIQESGHLFEEEELLVDSMKTGIEDLEKEFETDIGETAEEKKEPQDVTRELLVEFEMDLCETKLAAGDVRQTDENFLKAEVQKMTETSCFQESVDATNLRQNSNMTPSLLEDITESGFLKQSDATEPKILEEDAGMYMEEEAAEDEMQNKDEMEILHCQVAGSAELSRPDQSPEMMNQLLDEALEMTKVEMSTNDDESKMADSKSKDLTLISMEEGVAKHVTESEGSYAEETVHLISGCQDVIEEEILDLWIQTALSEDTDGIKQEQEEQMEPSHEDKDEIVSLPQTEKDEVQLEKSNSELVSDREMSSSTVESPEEFEFLKSTSTGTSQGIYDTLVNMSESPEQPNSEPQGILMEEAAEMRRSYLEEEESITETPEARHLNQESDKSQVKTDEDQVESLETGSQKEIDAEVTGWKESEEADAESLTETSALLEVEKTAEDEITVTDAESGRSEASLEEESSSQFNTGAESELSEEDDADSLPEVADLPTTKSEEQVEVDTSALDFTAQRSRIAVKNPRVRPPKDPRSLLHMPSVDPTPSLHQILAAGVPLGGLGVGIKLPGLGAGFPVLKKTQRVVKDENSPDTRLQETKPEEKSDSPEPDEAQHKPKWMPPRHPGFGNPLMSELKTKLKKTTKE